MNFFAKIRTIYSGLLSRHPLIVQSVQTGFLLGAGDVIAQTTVEKQNFIQLNTLRTAQFLMMGTVLVGPVCATWYKFLSKTIGDSGKSVALKKMAIDQLLFAPNFIVVFITALNTIQGKSFEQIKEELHDKYLDILLNNYKFWPAVQIFNFYLVPLPYQLLVVQTVALFWNVYISWKTQQAIAIRK